MTNIHPTESRLITRKLRESNHGHLGRVFWLYGLSGSGKSTLAIAAEKILFESGHEVKVLDGDNIRSGLNSDLKFSNEDRKENIRRIAQVAKLFCDSGIICIVSFITPKKEFRDQARKIIGSKDFQEIYIKSSYEICKKRDVKGLYKLAEEGKIKDFTGKGDNFEEPNFDNKENGLPSPDLFIDTEREDINNSVEKLINFINKKITL